METYQLIGSEKTPHFTLNTNGKITFGGISMPEDAATFYFGIMDWLSDYYRNPCKNTEVTVNFRYLNSSSSSMIFKIFHFLKRLQDSGKSNISCTWYYEESDENMRDYIDRVIDHANNINFKVKSVENVFDA